VSDRTDALACRLGAEIDALSRALAAAGVGGEAAARLLESAALAAMHAVSLEALAEAPPERPRRGERRASVTALPRAA